jgi:hypothetical protein
MFTASVRQAQSSTFRCYVTDGGGQRALTFRTRMPAFVIWVVVVGHSLRHAEAVHAHLRAQTHARAQRQGTIRDASAFREGAATWPGVALPCHTVPAMRSL